MENAPNLVAWRVSTLSRLSLNGDFRRCCNKLDVNHRSIVTTAGSGLDDPSVATRTTLEALRQIDEHLLNQIHSAQFLVRNRPKPSQVLGEVPLDG